MVTLSPFVFIVYLYVVYFLATVVDWDDIKWRLYLMSTDYIVMLVCDLDAFGVLASLAMH